MTISWAQADGVSLRTEQRELTRSKIVQAVLDLVADDALDDLSMPAVARRSGVSLATIYRYFPTKDALIAAAAREPARVAFADGFATREGEDVLAAFLRGLWPDLAGNLPLLRHQLSSAAGREMRQSRLEQSRRRYADFLPQFGIDPASPEGERLVAALVLVTGSLALVELHDRQGQSVGDAIETAHWAAMALIESTRKERP
jgi:AcrR family transcriptional regulator